MSTPTLEERARAAFEKRIPAAKEAREHPVPDPENFMDPDASFVYEIYKMGFDDAVEAAYRPMSQQQEDAIFDALNEAYPQGILVEREAVLMDAIRAIWDTRLQQKEGPSP